MATRFSMCLVTEFATTLTQKRWPVNHEQPQTVFSSLAVTSVKSIITQNCNLFEAICSRPDHKEIRCRLTRSSKASNIESPFYNPGQGRPLGALVCWLISEFEGYAHEHASPTFSKSFSFGERSEGRRFLYASPGGREYATRFERPKRGDEDSEPEADP